MIQLYNKQVKTLSYQQNLINLFYMTIQSELVSNNKKFIKTN